MKKEKQVTARLNHGAVWQVFRGLFAFCLLTSVAGVLHAAEIKALDDFEYVEPSSDFEFQVWRCENNPIVRPEMLEGGKSGDIGSNINGPSLIRVPDWIEDPLGEYYLYFANHRGSYIRLAYADSLEGPWKIYKPGVLPLKDCPGRGHVASPDVHIDEEKQRIRMYYHSPRPADEPRGQGTYAAVSDDGLNFDPLDEYLGQFYFRVFERDGWYYALAKNGNSGGIMYRSKDPLSGFEKGPRILPRVRHMALWEHNDMLYVFFSRGKDKPERILVSRVENLEDDWEEWRFTEPQTVLKPEKDYEGVEKPIKNSRFGVVYSFVHQLREPAIYEENGDVYLLYSAAGEFSICIAKIKLDE